MKTVLILILSTSIIFQSEISSGQKATVATPKGTRKVRVTPHGKNLSVL